MNHNFGRHNVRHWAGAIVFVLLTANIAVTRAAAARQHEIVVNANGGGDHRMISGPVRDGREGREIWVRPGAYQICASDRPVARRPTARGGDPPPSACNPINERHESRRVDALLDQIAADVSALQQIVDRYLSVRDDHCDKRPGGDEL
jgi:hypothetical protein